ncbi:broad-specificity cellobiase [Granulicella rosea]|uniref:Beta-glucosidase n=2 Tax=Granulicella rosea TaxID=474952 RepID=A0A239MJ47_9BACT|nr:broad-specificity cellobiase [Granulicella rosea]
MGRRSEGFPDRFLWGSATASYQVEGSVNDAGRGPSIWDTFSHTPGKVANHDTGDVADDFFRRYRDDVQLMNGLGIQAFRFSVAWPRVFPTGGGMPNPQGLDFYLRLVEELHAHGIEPFCTLYHWDMPQALQDRGGWESRDTAYRLAEYAGYVAGKLSAVGVKHFFTMNEIRTFVELGYGNGTHAPGLKVGRKRLAQLNHHALLGHGLSVQSIRAHAVGDVQVGVAENPIAPVPVTPSGDDIAAARTAMREENASYLTAILEGVYTDRYLAGLGVDAPHFTAEEMRIISTPLDVLGLNFYTSTYVRASHSPASYETLALPADFPHMASSWLTVSPECVHWGPRLVHECWRPKAIYITENGCSADDGLNANGECLDTGRIMYLRNCLSQLEHALAHGAPVQGYFVWSLLDNFEWADGYGKRFGIVHVDFKTQKRTPKLSARFYQKVIEGNGKNL